MSDRIVAIIRTVVPPIVGALATWGAKHLGVQIDSVGATTAAVAGVTTVYWFVVSALERRWPTFGVLLGVPSGPPLYGHTQQTAQLLETGPSTPFDLSALFPPGTSIVVPTQPFEPHSFLVTVDATGVHINENTNDAQASTPEAT